MTERFVVTVAESLDKRQGDFVVYIRDTKEPLNSSWQYFATKEDAETYKEGVLRTLSLASRLP